MPPQISVVVAATDSATAVAACLASLGLDDRTEILVAYDPARVAGESPWIAGLPGSGVHHLRRLGLNRTRGDIVLFTEDSCRFLPGWADAWIEAFADSEVDAATGTVEHREGASLVDWGVFFCEYAPFLRSKSETATPTRLAGNHFAVARRLVERLPAEIHETSVAAQAFRVTRASAVAVHVRQFGMRQAIDDRLRFGFEFGRHQARESRFSRRLIHILGGPLMLGSQVGRLVGTLIRKRRCGGVFLAAAPWTVALLTAWTVGEWLGWIKTGDRRVTSSR